VQIPVNGSALARIQGHSADPSERSYTPVVNLLYNHVGNLLYISNISYRLNCTKCRLKGRADCSNFGQARGALLCLAYGMVTYFRDESQGRWQPLWRKLLYLN
jgi:hypothetical protein